MCESETDSKTLASSVAVSVVVVETRTTSVETQASKVSGSERDDERAGGRASEDSG